MHYTLNFSQQLGLGSGWVLEPFDGDASRTLVSYLVHVRVAIVCLFVCLFDAINQ